MLIAFDSADFLCYVLVEKLLQKNSYNIHTYVEASFLLE